MLIQDIDHLQTLSKEENKDNPNGQGIVFPTLFLDGFVQAYSFPSVVQSSFRGYVDAGYYASLRVFETVFVKAGGIFGP